MMPWQRSDGRVDRRAGRGARPDRTPINGGSSRAREFPPTYHTVTTSESRAPDEVIRAVFSPSITLVELQTILDEAQLRIISGPTEAGVYSLAANSRRPVSSSLALLRRHAAVRFAESTEPSAKPSQSHRIRRASMRRWGRQFSSSRWLCACSNAPVRIESRALANPPPSPRALHHCGRRQRSGGVSGRAPAARPAATTPSRPMRRARARAR